jgi:DNA replication and repair protein RecF
VTYRASVTESVAAAIAAGEVPEIEELTQALLGALGDVREAEIERGQCLVGPHRDDLVLQLGSCPRRATPATANRGRLRWG